MKNVASTFTSITVTSTFTSIAVGTGFSPSWLVVFFLLCGASLPAQLSTANNQHPEVLPLHIPVLGAAAGAVDGLRGNVFSPVAVPATPIPEPFDFTKTAPHLAFFCRLEINEKAGFVIPAKFRLGGHRYWQDELGKRE